MALLTKLIGIVTPLMLSIVVVVALRWISYQNAETRSYRTKLATPVIRSHRIVQGHQIVLYWASMMGRGERKKKAVQLVCEVGEVRM